MKTFLNKKAEAEYVKTVYDEILAGVYSPDRLNKAFKLLNDTEMPLNVLQKKRAVSAYANYHYEKNIKELSENTTPTKSDTELVDLVKSTNKRKKRVTKITNKKD